MSDTPAPAARKHPASEEANMPDISGGRGVGGQVKVFPALVSIAAVAALSLGGCSSHKGAHVRTPQPQSTGPISVASPSPTDTAVISQVPSIVPFVNEALKKQGIDLPLEAEKSECHPGQPSHTGVSGNTLQVCRWHPDKAGDTSYRILSVTISVNLAPKEAEQHLKSATGVWATAPRPVALGTEATVGAARLPNKSVTIRGEDQNIDVSGAALAIRVHNVSIDVDWLGADYTIGAHGIPENVTGLALRSATRQATAIAKAIIAHIG